MKLAVDFKKATYWLFGVIFGLNAFGLGMRILTHFLGMEINESLLRLFDTAEEANITSWFSSVLLFIAALLVLLISRIKKWQMDVFARHWSMLAVLFFFLSLDETAGLHEMTIQPLRNALGASGALYFTWVVLVIPLIVILGIVFLRFLMNLPVRTRLQFVIAGAVFFAGAVGFELLGGLFHDRGFYRILIATEETLENIGTGIFIVSLLSYTKPILDLASVELEIL
jgi:hypothetical protein